MKINWSKIATYPAPLRLGIFIAILLICWLPIALPLYLIFNYDPNLTSILTMVVLFGIFLFLLKFWSDRVYGIRKGFEFYGLVWTRQNGIDWLKGIAIGLLLTFTLFFTESLFGWVQIQPSKVFLLKIILEGSLTGLGVAFAEELFFRGWILTELEKDYSLNQSLWSNALIFATLMSIIVLHLTPAPGEYNSQLQDGLQAVFGNTWRIVIGSMTAFWCGSLINAYVLAKMKIWSNGKYLWMRMIGSTAAGELVDSAIFYFVAFYGIWSTQQVIEVALAQYVLKTGWEILAVPFTYRVVQWLKEKESVDHYDVTTNFNPFKASL